MCRVFAMYLSICDYCLLHLYISHKHIAVVGGLGGGGSSDGGVVSGSDVSGGANHTMTKWQNEKKCRMK